MRVISILGGIILAISACNSDAPNNTSNQPLTKDQQKTLKAAEALPTLTLEPQVTFDQSQLTNDALRLCVQFKGTAERKAIFEKLAPLLPNCPTSTGADGATITNTDEAVQIMTYRDLVELLGEPNELREDGSVVYYLTASGDYVVVFTRDARQAVSCRYLEARG